MEIAEKAIVEARLEEENRKIKVAKCGKAETERQKIYVAKYQKATRRNARTE